MQRKQNQPPAHCPSTTDQDNHFFVGTLLLFATQASIRVAQTARVEIPARLNAFVRATTPVARCVGASADAVLICGLHRPVFTGAQPTSTSGRERSSVAGGGGGRGSCGGIPPNTVSSGRRTNGPTSSRLLSGRPGTTMDRTASFGVGVGAETTPSSRTPMPGGRRQHSSASGARTYGPALTPTTATVHSNGRGQ